MRQRFARLLIASVFAALLAAAGCAPASEPLPRAGSLTVVLCRSLTAKQVAGGTLPSAAALAARGASALVARPVREYEPLADAVARAGVRVVQAGDAVADPEGADAAIARVVREDPRGAVLVVSEPSDGSHGFVTVAGPGVEPGLLASMNAHAAGVLAADDVASLALFLAGDGAQSRGVDVVPSRGTDATERLARLEAYYGAARAAQAPIVVAFGVLAGLSVLGLWGLAAAADSARTRYWRLVAHRSLLFALCLPSATLLSRLVDRYPQDPARVLVLVLGIAGATWLAMSAVLERRGAAAGVVAASALTAIVLAADQSAGAPLVPGTAFSYSPLDGFRYYGMGNEGAALLVGSWLAAAALSSDVSKRSRWLPWTVAGGLFALVVAALPVLGANSAVALWGTVTMGVFVVEATHGRVRVRDTAGIAAAAAVAVGLVVVAERLFGAATHVGGAVAGGSAGVLAAAAQRLAAVIRAYAEHPTALVGFAAWGVLAWARIRPPAALARAMEARPAVRAAATAALTGGAFASLVEDSSVIVMVLLALYAGAALAVAAHAPRTEGE